MLSSTLYTLRPIHNWAELVKSQQELPKATGNKKTEWIYRGQKRFPELDPKLDFASSLERAALAFNMSLRRLPGIERKLLKEFKRRLHHYTSNIPDENDDLEWLALMQDYGAPTRLLDWSYSFYVAAYFALEKAHEKGFYDVWALNARYFLAPTALSGSGPQPIEVQAQHGKRKASRVHEDTPHMARNVTLKELRTKPMTCVHTANPFRLNERLTIQQGVFLFPGDIRKPLEDNLSAKEYAAQSSQNLVRFKMNIDVAERRRIMERLYRMNISRATLFPGLGGFAESLRTRLPFLPPI